MGEWLAKVWVNLGLGKEGPEDVHREQVPMGSKNMANIPMIGLHFHSDIWIFFRPGRQALSCPPCRSEGPLLELQRYWKLGYFKFLVKIGESS